MEFSLDAEFAVRQWSKQGGRCFYTNLPLTTNAERGPNGRPLWSQASIDRVDNSKGYTPENCVLCCLKLNEMKSDSTLAEIELLCRAFVKNADLSIC